MLPRCILASPMKEGCTQWRVTEELVKSRIRRWLAGDFTQLWADVLAEEERRARRNQKRTTPLETLHKANARRARRAMEDGQYRKTIQPLSSGGLAQVTPEVCFRLLLSMTLECSGKKTTSYVA